MGRGGAVRGKAEEKQRKERKRMIFYLTVLLNGKKHKKCIRVRIVSLIARIGALNALTFDTHSFTL